MNKLLSLAMLTMLSASAMAQTTITVNVKNPANAAKESAPVVVSLKDYGFAVKSALVKLGNEEIPCQLDDLDKDGTNDELCFVTPIGKKEQKTFTITLLPTGKPRQYTPRVYNEMLLPNKKVKEKNKQDIYISCLTYDHGGPSYSVQHHHGVAFESELTCFRIYFDARQSIDLYGKHHKQLELKETQFYPSKEQLAAGYGDDVLWAGNTFALGAFRGWDGKQQQPLEKVEHRTQRIISNGPVRSVVEVLDDQWEADPAKEPIDVKLRYTIWAGHRDVDVDAFFRQNVNGYKFSTGVIRVKGSTEFNDHKGLRGCWGSDWAVAEKDSAGHKRETVGLGIYIPKPYLLEEIPTTADELPFVIGTTGNHLRYHITFCSDNEDFGYHSSKDWFDAMKNWRKEVDTPVEVNVVK